jgi:preprotein translocase subunit SecA
MAFSFGKVFTTVFGSRNERLIKRYRKMVASINAMEPQVQKLTDEQLRERTQELRVGLTAGKLKSADVLPEGFAILRESMDRNIGIRQIFNPEENFDPDQFDDETLALYDSVQRQMIADGSNWLKVPIPLKLYEAVRKLYPESRPPFRARCFDVQLIGGLVMYEGRIAEMATGEGKTFVAPIACFMRVLEGYHCHVVTVNDYLVKRDSMWVLPAFENLGMTVGYLQQDLEPGGEARRKQYACDITYGTNSEFGFDYLRDNMKERADLQVQGPLDFAIVDEVDSALIDEARTPLIISGGAHDDADKYRAADVVARAVVEKNKPWDAVDKAEDLAKRAIKAAAGDEEKAKDKPEKEAARKRQAEAETQLAEAEKKKEGLVQYFEVEMDKKSVHLTHEGVAAAQEKAGVGSFYVGNNMEWPHLMEQSLRAHVVYTRDKDYVVERVPPKNEMEVVIVDEFTGRKMAGRQWSDGLHQACEAKEGVPIKQETQTLATITLQNFFKLYRALSGMTGTAQTEAEEFHKIYQLDVVTIPTNRPNIRRDSEDRVFKTEDEKWKAILEEIREISATGRPVLVGTTSVEKSEMLSNRLNREYGVEHEVLNAKNHEREASIIALAGQQHKNRHGELVGNVTIATNMAGRGTDIKPAQSTFFDVVEKPKDGKGNWVVVQKQTGKRVEVEAPKNDDEFNPLADHLQLTRPNPKIVGGLHVIGTERHTSRRIDNQLRGRSGRQGDPGSSRFYISLRDDLMSMFAGEWTIKVLGMLGMEEGMPIEDKRISKGILNAQKKVEERNYLSRKSLLDYDDVMDAQRTSFYGLRQRVLEGRDVPGVIWRMINDSIKDAADTYVTKDFVAASVAEWAATNFQVNIDPGDLRRKKELHDLEKYVREQARNEARTNIGQTLGEFTGEDEGDTSTWDTGSLQSWAMSRFGVNLTKSQIRKSTPEDVEQMLIDAAIEQIDKRDTTGLEKYLEPQYAEAQLAIWAREKFGIELTPEEIAEASREARNSPADAVAELIQTRAKAEYGRRDLEYPVNHLLTFAFGGETGKTDNPYAAECVRLWALCKYDIGLTIDHIRSKSVREIHDELIGYHEQMVKGGKMAAEVDRIIQANHGKTDAELAAAATARFTVDAPPIRYRTVVKEADIKTARIEGGDAAVKNLLLDKGIEFLRRELTDLEQYVLIQIFDTTWKDHLYAMDMLKSGVGLIAFAEQDPKIVYKKEGYEFFLQMMSGIRDKVTARIFQAKVMGTTPTKSNYRETAAVHADSDNPYGVVNDDAQTTSGGGGGGGGGTETVTKPIVREEPKVGRNDPCPCGSGKKYKKCHGAEVA